MSAGMQRVNCSGVKSATAVRSAYPSRNKFWR
jgi:hypothetical protein